VGRAPDEPSIDARRPPALLLLPLRSPRRPLRARAWLQASPPPQLVCPCTAADAAAACLARGGRGALRASDCSEELSPANVGPRGHGLTHDTRVRYPARPHARGTDGKWIARRGESDVARRAPSAYAALWRPLFSARILSYKAASETAPQSINPSNHPTPRVRRQTCDAREHAAIFFPLRALPQGLADCRALSEAHTTAQEISAFGPRKAKRRQWIDTSIHSSQKRTQNCCSNAFRRVQTCSDAFRRVYLSTVEIDYLH